jgi:hypothetical protein
VENIPQNKPNAKAKCTEFTVSYQFLFWRTLRLTSLGRFRTIIHSMMDVARDSPYLYRLVRSRSLAWARWLETYHVKMYWLWLFFRFTSAARPIGMPFSSRVIASRKSGTEWRRVSHVKDAPSNGHDSLPIVCSIHTGWLPVSSAICSTSGK